MNDLGVIDRFMTAFIRYIDSGFGLLGGDVSFLTSTLVAINLTLAGLFWAMGGEDNVLGRLIRKNSLHRRVRIHHQFVLDAHRHLAIQSLREGDRGGSGAIPDIKERDD